jgi:hypothetical protein
VSPSIIGIDALSKNLGIRSPTALQPAAGLGVAEQVDRDGLVSLGANRLVTSG